MIGSRYPYCSIRFENTFCFINPLHMKWEIILNTFWFIPISLINFRHLSCMNSKSSIWEKIRRISKNNINIIFWKLFHNFNAISLIQTEIVSLKKRFHKRRINKVIRQNTWICCCVLANIKGISRSYVRQNTVSTSNKDREYPKRDTPLYLLDIGM